jgi:PKD repeat protein
MVNRIGLALLVFNVAFNLNNSTAQSIDRCGTHKVMQKMIEMHPQMQAEKQEFEQYAQDFNDNGQRAIKVIPIVFHIIHTYGSENISREQVEDAVRILNEDYQLLNEDQSEVVSAFAGIKGNTQFEFRLARKDPNGNCTDGITRTFSPLTFNGNDNVKALISWPRNRYLNVWVVNDVVLDDGTQVGGYAYQPSNFISASVDGIIVTNQQFGSIGTSSSSNFASRTLTHEVGHWFNLNHTWGDSNSPGLSTNCNDDDGVTDTPNCIGVANQSCNLSQVTCGSLDNVQNYMDYSACGLMFTAGQSSRMNAAANSNQGQRSSLWSASNLSFTGVDGAVVPCAPIADFSSSTNEVCTNTSVTFSDESYNSEIDGTWQWSWTFTGASTPNSTSQNPTVQYANPGVYNVSLTVSNSAGTNTRTKTSYITVRPDNPTLQAPFFEGIENTAFPNISTQDFYDWKVVGASNSFFRTTEAEATGSASLKYNNNVISDGVISEIVSPIFDCSAIAAPVNLTFKVAYARRSSSSTDKLIVYASTNCGRSWTPRYTKTGASLSTLSSGQYATGTFIPSAAQWRTETVSIPAFAGASNAMIKFAVTDGGGNSLFIDDINFFGDPTLGYEFDAAGTFNSNILPNPSTGEDARLSLELFNPSEVKVNLRDITGKLMGQLDVGKLSDGQHTINLNQITSSSLQAGVYFVEVICGKTSITHKWVCIR